MKAGVAKVDITPMPGLVLQGHAGAPPSSEVLYPLETRAVCFADGDVRALIVSIDIIGVEWEFTKQIRAEVSERTGVDTNAIMLCCSHTHCAPATLGSLNLVPDPAWLERVRESVVEACVEATDNLVDVKLNLGTASAHFGVNRRPHPESEQKAMTPNDEQISDRRVRILRVDHANGQPLTVLFSYACHPTTLSGQMGKISSDYPGVAREMIDRELDCVSLYLPGCFGNQRPKAIDESNNFTAGTVQLLQFFGESLANSVIKATRCISTVEASSISYSRRELAIAYAPFASIDELQETINLDPQKFPNKLFIAWANKVLKMVESGNPPASIQTEMQILRVGPLQLITIPGEPALEFGLAIEYELWQHNCPYETWPLGYTNDMVGYLCTPRQHQQGGYEPIAYKYFLQPAAFKDEQETIQQAAMQLWRDMRS